MQLDESACGSRACLQSGLPACLLSLRFIPTNTLAIVAGGVVATVSVCAGQLCAYVVSVDIPMIRMLPVL
jgi:hypothetical protein